MSAVRRDSRYTYADYLSWPDEERRELIRGVVYNMTPSPSRRHQGIAGELHLRFSNQLRGKRCKVDIATFDVRLPAPRESDETTSTVVQLDLVMVCDPGKLADRGCKGAPDPVIEILSPESVARDQREKFLLYEQAGVEEYWLVHPTDKILTVFRRGAGGQYGRPVVFSGGERVPVGAIPELEIDLTAVFAE